MEKLSLKHFASAANNQNSRHSERLRRIIFDDLPDAPKYPLPIPAMFLNISLKSYFAAMHEMCASIRSHPALPKGYEENYAKVYSRIVTTIPNADQMTIGTFLCFLYENYLKYGLEAEKDPKDLAQGRRIAEAFFTVTFTPLLRKRGITYASVVSRLRSAEPDRKE